MNTPKILLIGDEPNLLLTLRRNLFSRGYEVSLALDDQEAVLLTSSINPDLIILNLDFTILAVDGLAVCSKVRNLCLAPMIVLSTVGNEASKVAALDMGADDYLVMPFAMDEFLARVRASLRRWEMLRGDANNTGELILVGELLIDMNERRVTVKNQAIKLTPREYDILVYLANHAGKVVTHRELLKAVWGNVYGEEREYLRVFISQLRRKIEEDSLHPMYILTEPGVGYRFSNPSQN